MTNDIIQQAQAKIDAEILDLEGRILALRSSRNALTPIYRLPAEVLSEIFTCVQDLWVEDNPDHLTKWTIVTHVSRHWRRIALECRMLWSDIPMDCVSYVEEAIQRSGNVNISLFDLYIPDTVNWDQKLKPLVLSASSRIHKLILSTTATQALLPEWSDCISQSLEELALSSWDWATPAFFPKSLRWLKIDRSAFRWEWLQLPQLSELQLVIDNPENQTSVASFLEVISHLPLLTVLTIQTIFDEDEENAEETIQPIPPRVLSLSRPRLHHLTLQGTLPSITQLLSHLQLVDDFSLHIQTIDLHEYPLADLVQCIDKHIRASRHVIRHADIRRAGSEDNCFILTLLDENCPKWFLQIMIHGAPPTYYEWMKAFQVLPFEHLEKLSSSVFRETIFWKDSFLRKLKHLGAMVLTNGATTSAFLEYLTEEAQAARERGEWELPFFRSLAGLVLVDVELTRKMVIGLKEALGAKARHGLKLQYLMLSKCEVPNDSIGRLEALVDKIECVGSLDVLTAST